MSDRTMKVWAVVFAIVVFLGGFGAGVIFGTRLELRRPAPIFGFGPPRGFPDGEGGPGRGMRRGPRGPGQEFLMGRLTSELNLTDAQRAQVDAVFTKRRERLTAVRDEIRTRFEKEQREFREEVKKVLTPEQQKKFDALLEQGPRRFGGPRF